MSLNFCCNDKGFTLVEGLLGVFLASMLSVATVYVALNAVQQQRLEKVQAMLAQKRVEFQNTISSDAAWEATIATQQATSAQLNCTKDLAGCKNVSGPLDFSLYDASGVPVYTSGPGNGLNLDGSQCTGSPLAVCPFLLSLKWNPSCNFAVDPNCNRPFITVSGTYTATSSSGLPGPFNFSKYNFTVNRQALSWSPCLGPLPVCAPQIPPQLILCYSQGWTCVPANNPYCQGPVSWSDSVTGYSGCTANISPPVYSAVQHDTISPLIANTTAIDTGSAKFLCAPGQNPGNSNFIVQAGAVCYRTPINGLCGPANGKTFASAAIATSAGLCSPSGSVPSTVLTDPGPWNWTCSGQFGGAPSGPCSAKDTPIPGLCGPASTSGNTYASAAAATTAGLCSTGSPSHGLTDPGPWSWTCSGQYGGANSAICQTRDTPIAGVCGGANGRTFANASMTVSAGLCAPGNPASTPSGNGPWSWTCLGQYGGAASGLCSANQSVVIVPVNGSCGSANGAAMASAPSGGALCTTGTPTAVSGTGTPSWNWGCDGSGGGVNSSCFATLSVSTPPGSTGACFVWTFAGNQSGQYACKCAVDGHLCGGGGNTAQATACIGSGGLFGNTGTNPACPLVPPYRWWPTSATTCQASDVACNIITFGGLGDFGDGYAACSTAGQHCCNPGGGANNTRFLCEIPPHAPPGP